MKRWLSTLGLVVAFVAAWELAAPADAAPVRHSDLGPTNGIHVVQHWAPADAAARLALSVVSGDIGKVARQTDTGEYYLLTSTSPTWTKIPGLNHAATSVLGRSAGTAGAWADITASADDRVLSRSSGALGFTTVSAAMLAANSVTNAKLRQSAGVSLVGRSANSTGDVADITASADGQVLARQGGVLAFAAISSVTGTDTLKTTGYAGKFRNLGGGAGVTYYWQPYGHSDLNTPPTNIWEAQFLAPRDGSIKNLRFINANPNGDADTFTLTLNVNGSGTTLTLSGLSANTSSLQSDTTHSVSVSMGDLVCFVQVTGGAGINGASGPTWSYDFVEN